MLNIHSLCIVRMGIYITFIYFTFIILTIIIYFLISRYNAYIAILNTDFCD